MIVRSCAAGRWPSCGAIFDRPRLQKQLEEVEKQVADPNLWQNPEQSQRIMRERKRLEGQLTTEENLARRAGDIAAYFELAREGEDVTADLRREIDTLRDLAERVETETLLGGETDRLNAIIEDLLMLSRVEQEAEKAEIQAVVIRADGTREDLGTIAYYHKNPLKRWFWNLRKVIHG